MHVVQGSWRVFTVTSSSIEGKISKSVLHGLCSISLKDAVFICKIEVTLVNRSIDRMYVAVGLWNYDWELASKYSLLQVPHKSRDSKENGWEKHSLFQALLLMDKVVNYTFIYAIIKVAPLYARVRTYLKVNMELVLKCGKRSYEYDWGCLLPASIYEHQTSGKGERKA